MAITKSFFGTTRADEAVDLYTLQNKQGTSVSIMTYGGTVTSLKIRDKAGQLADVVLGFDTLVEYEEKSPYFGCIVGRYANRIDRGKFTLDGKDYTLVCNNDGNHLHGGNKGFDKVIWAAETQEDDAGQQLILRYTSPDGEEGYPGQLELRVTYTLTQEDELRMHYHAETDKATIINLTNHSYFNLAATGDILGHELTLNADSFVAIDEHLIPTGEMLAVKDTPFDFSRPRTIGARIDEENDQLRAGLGYDHTWVCNKTDTKLGLAARVIEAASGRVLEAFTTQPGIHVYAGNMMDTVTGKGGQAYGYRTGFCLETGHFPNSVNQPNFPATVLRPGEVYDHTTVFRFSTV